MARLLMKAEKRKGMGTGNSRRMRRVGRIPGIVYGGDKAPLPVMLNAHDVQVFLRRVEGENVLLDLQVTDEQGGTEHKTVLMRECQHDPVRGDVLHIDFNEVSMTETIRVSVPLVVQGTAVGVAQEGGVLEHLVREIEIECLPGDLPEHIAVDVSALHVGQNFCVRDLALPAGIACPGVSPEMAVLAVSAVKVDEEPRRARRRRR